MLVVTECDPPTGLYNFDSGVVPGIVSGTVIPISVDDKSVEDAIFAVPWMCWSLVFL